MNIKLAAACFATGALLAPVAAFADGDNADADRTPAASAKVDKPARSDDGDADRKHPVTFVKDSAITVKVKAKLAAEKMSSLAKVHVDTDAGGVVYLTGNVRSQEDADKAVAIARGTERVTSVVSKLQIKKDD